MSATQCLVQLIDFLPVVHNANSPSMDQQLFTEISSFLLGMLKNKFENQCRGSLQYHKTKCFLAKQDFVDIPVEFYNDRDLFETILNSGRTIQYPEKWFKIWMKDYEIMKKIVISSEYLFSVLDRELKKHNNQSLFIDLIDDFSFWTSFIGNKRYNFQYIPLASKRIRRNLEMMKTLVSIQPDSFKYMDEKMKKNNELVKVACEYCGSFFNYLRPNLLTKKMVIGVIEKNSYIDFKKVPQKMWDFEIATAVAKHLPHRIYEIPKAFRVKEIVMLAIEQGGGYVFQKIEDSHLKKDKELNLLSIRNGGSYTTDTKLKFDKDIALAAVEYNYSAYITIPDTLKCDLDVCLTALKKSGSFLYEMPDEIKSNRSIILQAVKTNANALYYAPKEYLIDREVILTAFTNKNTFDFDYNLENYIIDHSTTLERRSHKIIREKFPPLIDFIPKEEFIKDREVILQIVKHFPKMLSFVSDENLINDREFLQDCLKMNGDCFEFIPSQFKFDFDLCRIALKNFRNSIIHFPLEVQTDRRIFNDLYGTTLPLNGQERSKLAKEIKDQVAEREYWSRKNVYMLDGVGFSIVDCQSLAQLRRERLEKHYFGCYVPIKNLE